MSDVGPEDPRLEMIYEKLEKIDPSTFEKRAGELLFGLGFSQTIAWFPVFSEVLPLAKDSSHFSLMVLGVVASLTIRNICLHKEIERVENIAPDLWKGSSQADSLACPTFPSTIQIGALLHLPLVRRSLDSNLSSG